MDRPAMIVSKQKHVVGCLSVMEKYYYALLLAGSIAVPLMRSFETRVRFREKWPALFAGILVMMLVFIPWDIIFTRDGVWAFNHSYVLGYYISGLPIEEWLFFVIIPYCVVFTYEVFRYFFPRFVFPKAALGTTLFLGVLFLILAVFNTDRIYTFVVMLLVAILALFQPLVRSHKTWLSHFFLTYVVILIPFVIINGALTGMFTEMPVVSYNDAENLGIRIFTIPVEDAVYLMGMMFIVQMVYEWVRRK